MNPALFLPVVVLAFLTLAVLLLVPVSRRHGPKAGEAGAVDTPNRAYMNLLEAPVLFYVACVVLFLTGGASYLAIALAWVYVVARIAHAAILLTYNRPAHRGAAFAASNVVLVALWVMVTVRVVAALSIPR